MASKVYPKDILVAVVAAASVGIALGLGVGLLARQLGWSTKIAGQVTGVAVSTLVAVFYERRRRLASDAADPPTK